MTLFIALVLGFVAVCYIISWFSFAYHHPWRTLIAVSLGIAIAPENSMVVSCLFFFFVFWLCSSRDGLIVLGSFILGFWLATRKN